MGGSHFIATGFLPKTWTRRDASTGFQWIPFRSNMMIRVNDSISTWCPFGLFQYVSMVPYGAIRKLCGQILAAVAGSIRLPHPIFQRCSEISSDSKTQDTGRGLYILYIHVSIESMFFFKKNHLSILSVIEFLDR